MHREGWCWEASRDLAVLDAGATALAALMTAMLRGEVPPLAAAWLRSGTQMALRKDEVGGVRPAVMGCGLRRVAARLLVRRLLPALRAFCEPDNFAVGTPSGCQQVLVALRADSEAAVLDALEALDLRNAHNSFCRRTVEWVLERDEGLAPLLPMVRMFMGEAASALHYYGADRSAPPLRTYMMCWGGHQGCALTSAVFPVLLTYLLRRAHAAGGAAIRRYALQDDLYRRGPLADLMATRPQVVDTLQRWGALESRADKSAAVLPALTPPAGSPEAALETAFTLGMPAAQVSRADTGGLRRALGAPVSTSSTFTHGALLELSAKAGTLADAAGRMAAVHPTEAAKLIRVCCARQLLYLFSTLPPAHTRDAAAAATARVAAAFLTAVAATDAERRQTLAAAASADDGTGGCAAQLTLTAAWGGADIPDLMEAAERAYLATLATVVPLLLRRFEDTAEPAYAQVRLELAALPTGSRPWQVAARAALELVDEPREELPVARARLALAQLQRGVRDRDADHWKRQRRVDLQTARCVVPRPSETRHYTRCEPSEVRRRSVCMRGAQAMHVRLQARQDSLRRPKVWAAVSEAEGAWGGRRGRGGKRGR